MRSEKLYGQFKGIIRNGGKVEANDPTRAGQDASKRQYFGEFNRYSVFAVHTRFDAVQWFVTDAETITDAQVRAGQLPAVIRQETTREAAMAGLQ
jgi:hypothetical protein